MKENGRMLMKEGTEDTGLCMWTNVCRVLEIVRYKYYGYLKARG